MQHTQRLQCNKWAFNAANDEKVEEKEEEIRIQNKNSLLPIFISYTVIVVMSYGSVGLHADSYTNLRFNHSLLFSVSMFRSFNVMKLKIISDSAGPSLHCRAIRWSCLPHGKIGWKLFCRYCHLLSHDRFIDRINRCFWFELIHKKKKWQNQQYAERVVRNASLIMVLP